jgi:glycopeptide antibiotics resistance protein
VCVDAGVSCCPSQVLALSERDVLTFTILEALGQTEVNDEDVVLVMLLSPYQEVVRFDVSVDNAFFMDLLNSLDLLIP